MPVLLREKWWDMHAIRSLPALFIVTVSNTTKVASWFLDKETCPARLHCRVSAQDFLATSHSLWSE